MSIIGELAKPSARYSHMIGEISLDEDGLDLFLSEDPINILCLSDPYRIEDISDPSLAIQCLFQFENNVFKIGWVWEEELDVMKCSI